MEDTKGLVSGFAAEDCRSKSIDDVWYTGKASLGVDDFEKGVVDSQMTDLGDNGSEPGVEDSLMLLPNLQLSPTTGTFPSQPLDESTEMVISASLVDAKKRSGAGSFATHTETNLPHLPKVSATGDLNSNMQANTDCQSLTAMNSQQDFEFFAQGCKEDCMCIDDANSPPPIKIPNAVNSNSSIAVCLDEDRPTMGDDLGTHGFLDGNQNSEYPRGGTIRALEDGYNWRKYGQKQVKGSEYPRSYYKCTHPTCGVKKIVERSPDGKITEIIYKGGHDHPKPQPCQKSTSESLLSFNETSEGDGSDSYMVANNAFGRRSMQSEYKDVIESDWRIDGSNNQCKPMDVLESARTLEFSSTMASHENDEEDVAAQKSFLIEHDNENEPEMKKRAREQKVVIMIDTEEDILSDGYRWRKYGQKVVKGNPNPRSYYKCTSPGCNVRKHVERSPESKNFVLTTYEWKHNHDVPTAKNNGHANSGSGSLSITTTNTRTSEINSHLPKPEPHIPDYPLHFDTKMGCDNDFLRPNFPGNLSAGSPWLCPLKLPSLPNNNSYYPYGSNVQYPTYISNSIMPTIPDLSFPLSSRFPPSMVSYCNTEMPCSLVQPLCTGQKLKEQYIRLLKPKQEPGDDSFVNTGSHSTERKDASTVLYNQSMDFLGNISGVHTLQQDHQ